MATLFDKDAFLERMLGDWELCLEIMDDFLSDIPEQIRFARSAAAAADLEALERQAHSIKGACANVAAEALRTIAHETEKLAKSGRVEQSEEKISDLEEVFERTRAEMVACHKAS